MKIFFLVVLQWMVSCVNITSLNICYIKCLQGQVRHEKWYNFETLLLFLLLLFLLLIQQQIPRVHKPHLMPCSHLVLGLLICLVHSSLEKFGVLKTYPSHLSLLAFTTLIISGLSFNWCVSELYLICLDWFLCVGHNIPCRGSQGRSVSVMTRLWARWPAFDSLQWIVCFTIMFRPDLGSIQAIT